MSVPNNVYLRKYGCNDVIIDRDGLTSLIHPVTVVMVDVVIAGVVDVGGIGGDVDGCGVAKEKMNVVCMKVIVN